MANGEGMRMRMRFNNGGGGGEGWMTHKKRFFWVNVKNVNRSLCKKGYES